MSDPIAQPVSGVKAERMRSEFLDALPLMLRSAVHANIAKGRFRQPWSKRMVLVKWVISGRAAMRIGGRRLAFGPGDVAIYTPTISHEFWAIAPESEMCWFSIDGPLAEQFAHLLGVRAGVFDYGAPPVERVDELIESLKVQTLESRRHSSELAVRMLYEVVQKIPSQQITTIVRQVRHLIHEGLNDPELSAKRIATKLDYNRGSLSRMFHQHSGMTIMDCITQSRLQQAEFLLLQSDNRISDIARKCGFADTSYFARWIKKHVGRMPHELRQSDAWGHPRNEVSMPVPGINVLSKTAS
jgi:AraC-like DNA-binding protein